MNLEEKLQNLEVQLRLTPQKIRKDHAHRRDLKRQITNLKAFLSFSEGMRVIKGEEVGTISQLSLSKGGMPEAWVKWDDHPNLPSPESPALLTPVLLSKEVITPENMHPENMHSENMHPEVIPQIEEVSPVEEVVRVDDVSEVSEDVEDVSEVSPVEELGELSPDEERDRLFWERKVERAFYEAGKALQELRDRRLYRNTHKTFEDYCRSRFGHSRQKANYLIAGAEVYENLTTTQTETTTIGCQTDSDNSEMTTIGCQTDDIEMTTIGAQGDIEEMCTIGAQILPSSERQVRPLTSLEPDQQREAWQEAINQSGGKVPTGKVVKSIVDQIRERRPVPNPWRVGDIATILVKDNPELKGKAGCWAIVTEVLDFSCIVRLWDGEYQVKIENLKELPYSPEHKQQFRELSDRLALIYSPNLEEAAKCVLSSLGRINRPILTELEEKLLRLIEEIL